MVTLSVPLATIVYLLAVRAVPDLYFVVGLGIAAILDWVTAPMWHNRGHESHEHEEEQPRVPAKPDQRLVS